MWAPIFGSLLQNTGSAFPSSASFPNTQMPKDASLSLSAFSCRLFKPTTYNPWSALPASLFSALRLLRQDSDFWAVVSVTSAPAPSPLLLIFQQVFLASLQSLLGARKVGWIVSLYVEIWVSHYFIALAYHVFMLRHSFILCSVSLFLFFYIVLGGNIWR